MAVQLAHQQLLNACTQCWLLCCTLNFQLESRLDEEETGIVLCEYRDKTAESAQTVC